jgi:hypothetical protein
MGAVALLGLLAYVFTPLGAAGPEGDPSGFAINIRFVVPALLLALALLPLPRLFDDRRRQWGLLAVLVLVLVVSDRSDTVLRDPDRVFAVAFALLVVGVPAGFLALRRRGAASAATAGGLAALLVVLLAIGYPVQRDYLEARFAADVPADERLPGEDLDAAYSWARGLEDARIGLAGTTAGFLGYGFYGTDLSNRVFYMGEDTAHGGFRPIATCEGFRRAVNDADLDYLVTTPFLNFVSPSHPVPSPEARWLRGSGATKPVLREGPVTVWRIDGPLEPRCDPAEAPLREIPDSPLPAG